MIPKDLELRREEYLQEKDREDGRIPQQSTELARKTLVINGVGVMKMNVKL